MQLGISGGRSPDQPERAAEEFDLNLIWVQGLGSAAVCLHDSHSHSGFSDNPIHNNFISNFRMSQFPWFFLRIFIDSSGCRTSGTPCVGVGLVASTGNSFTSRDLKSNVPGMFWVSNALDTVYQLELWHSDTVGNILVSLMSKFGSVCKIRSFVKCSVLSRQSLMIPKGLFQGGKGWWLGRFHLPKSSDDFKFSWVFTYTSHKFFILVWK